MTGNSIIIDGAKQTNTLKIDDQRRAHVLATSQSLALANSLNGDAFVATPPLISITTDTITAVSYVQNTELTDVDWAITELVIIAGDTHVWRQRRKRK